MPSDLAEWIDSHPGVRHNLGLSGMVGSIEHPTPSPSDLRSADADDLRRLLAADLRVDPRRLFLTHGATEGNAAVLEFLAYRTRGRPRRTVRVAWPEYPDLFDMATLVGFRPSAPVGPATVAVLSQPRNPEGDLWSRERILSYSEGAEHLLIDETFREFAGAPSWLDRLAGRLWTTGTFTKFYAGDDLRVGFVVAPEAERAPFERFHSLAFDRLPPYSVAGALLAFRARSTIRRSVDRVLEANRAAYRAAFPGEATPRGPVAFDRHGLSDGNAVAERCLAASILVCPGRFFGDPHGVRICLTRRTFPADLKAYLDEREGRELSRTPTSPRRRPRTARPRREGTARARAGRS